MVGPECINEVNVYRPNGWPRMCKWGQCTSI
jgi:hypothetical protein